MASGGKAKLEPKCTASTSSRPGWRGPEAPRELLAKPWRAKSRPAPTKDWDAPPPRLPLPGRPLSLPTLVWVTTRWLPGRPPSRLPTEPMTAGAWSAPATLASSELPLCKRPPPACVDPEAGRSMSCRPRALATSAPAPRKRALAVLPRRVPSSTRLAMSSRTARRPYGGGAETGSVWGAPGPVTISIVDSPSKRSSSSSVPEVICFSTVRRFTTGEALEAGMPPGGASEGSTQDRWFAEQLLDSFSPVDRRDLRAGMRNTMDIVLLTATPLLVHSFVVASFVVLTFVAEPNATTRFQSPFFSGSGFGSTSPKLFWAVDGVPECLFLLSPLLVVLARR
mmetsp:Transcript_26658/g.58768  ORF Transcript_26658/g.58768 Transcript_26658/m.58768 type:complete len:338 (-) Transcript_26658:565-1578(-)